jgi:hypothetical protein
MVNIPFVSEEFQRSFRNQFPSQTQTGRDLHVSDVVIPVVDFTPTTSGASLPQDLRFARNANTKQFNTTAELTNQVISDALPGFNLLDIKLISVGGLGYGELKLFDGTSTYNTVSYINGVASSGQSLFIQDSLVVYIPTGYQLTATTEGSGFNFNVLISLVATVDGDQILPFGYDPQ